MIVGARGKHMVSYLITLYLPFGVEFLMVPGAHRIGLGGLSSELFGHCHHNAKITDTYILPSSDF